MTHPAEGGFFEHHDPRQLPEVAEYLSQHPDVNPHELLVVPQVPVLIGGPKSRQFVVHELNLPPDAPPDPENTINLHKVVADANGARGFAEAFGVMEQQAERQYDITLLEVREQIAAAKERGNAITTMVPDTVIANSEGFLGRLSRLAQDTGLKVVIQTYDIHMSQVDSIGFKTIEPPAASSATEYWDGRQAATHIFDRERTVENSPDEQVLLGMQYLNEAIQADNTPYDWLQSVLSYIAHGNDLAVWAGLPDREPERDRLLAFLRQKANFGDKSTYNDIPMKVYTRTILAKVGDAESAALQMAEIRRNQGGRGSIKQSTRPLGIHMRHDRELLESVLTEVEHYTFTEPDTDGDEMVALVGALIKSEHPDVEPFILRCLNFDNHAHDNIIRNVLMPIFRFLPEHVEYLLDTSDGIDKQQALQALKERLAQLMEGLLHGELMNTVRRINHVDPMRATAAALFKMADPALEGLLKEYVLHYYRTHGSVIKNDQFEQEYLKYRRIYGDIAELANAITVHETAAAPSAAQELGTLATGGIGVEGVRSEVESAMAALREVQGQLAAAEAVDAILDALQAHLAQSSDFHAQTLLAGLAQARAKSANVQQTVITTIDTLQRYIEAIT